jgi:hypothetical protein
VSIFESFVLIDHRFCLFDLHRSRSVVQEGVRGLGTADDDVFSHSSGAETFATCDGDQHDSSPAEAADKTGWKARLFAGCPLTVELFIIAVLSIQVCLVLQS